MAMIAFNAPAPARRSLRLPPRRAGLRARLAAPRRVWQGRLLAAAGLALLPWMGYLAGTLPPAQAAAWVALDTAEAACLLTVGARLVRGEAAPRTAAATAALLLAADACLDLATAAPGAALAVAVTMAVCAELPLAGLCGTLAARAAARADRA